MVQFHDKNSNISEVTKIIFKTRKKIEKNFKSGGSTLHHNQLTRSRVLVYLTHFGVALT